MNLLRNLGRRKLRTALTISGITIGIWALVVFGALATKIDGLVAGAHAYFGDRVIVSSAAGGGGMFPLPISLVGAGRGGRRRRCRVRPDRDDDRSPAAPDRPRGRDDRVRAGFRSRVATSSRTATRRDGR